MNGVIVTAIWKEASERVEGDGERITLSVLKDVAVDLWHLRRSSPLLFDKVLAEEIDLVDAVIQASGPL